MRNHSIRIVGLLILMTSSTSAFSENVVEGTAVFQPGLPAIVRHAYELFLADASVAAKPLEGVLPEHAVKAARSEVMLQFAFSLGIANADDLSLTRRLFELVLQTMPDESVQYFLSNLGLFNEPVPDEMIASIDRVLLDTFSMAEPYPVLNKLQHIGVFGKQVGPGEGVFTEIPDARWGMSVGQYAIFLYVVKSGFVNPLELSASDIEQLPAVLRQRYARAIERKRSFVEGSEHDVPIRKEELLKNLPLEIRIRLFRETVGLSKLSLRDTLYLLPIGRSTELSSLLDRLPETERARAVIILALMFRTVLDPYITYPNGWLGKPRFEWNRFEPRMAINDLTNLNDALTTLLGYAQTLFFRNAVAIAPLPFSAPYSPAQVYWRTAIQQPNRSRLLQELAASRVSVRINLGNRPIFRR